jgi:hypothetical protein
MLRNKYHQAAVAYFIYGLLYLGGAFYAATAGVSERAVTSGSAVGWFVLGGLVVIVFPLLIWKQFKWFTRILAGLLVVRVGGLVYTLSTAAEAELALPGGGHLPVAHGTVVFLIITVVTCGLLIRAGWNLSFVSRAPSGRFPSE